MEKEQRPRRAQAGTWLTAAAARLRSAFALLAIVFLADYRRFRQFGFEGDDLGNFGSIIDRTFPAELHHLFFALTRWPQGRPLGVGLNLGLVPALAFRAGGLSGLHLGGFCLVALNACLLQRLLRRRCAPAAAFIAAAFFALSPAATVQLSLTYVYEFGIALTAALLAIEASLHGRVLRYGLLCAAAFTMYEPAAVVALVLSVGLLPPEATRGDAARRVGLWLGAVILLLGARYFIGDPWGGERVAQLGTNPIELINRALVSAALGPATHAGLLAERLLLPLRELDLALGGVLVSAGLIASATLWRADWKRPTSPARTAAQLAAAGLLGLFASYAMYFRDPWYPATARSGFLSGVHLIAALPASLLPAALAQAAAGWRTASLRRLAAGAACLAIALLCGFGELLQREYALSWQLQKKLWAAYEGLCPDAGPGTFVVILDDGLPRLRWTEIFSWGTEVMPLLLGPSGPRSAADEASGYDLTRHLREAPIAVLKGAPLSRAIAFDGHRYRWKPSDVFMLPQSRALDPVPGQVIVLEWDGRAFGRREGVVPVDGGELFLRRAVAGARRDSSPLAAVILEKAE